MSELEKILATASRLESASDATARVTAEELYRSIISSDIATLAGLIALAPPAERPEELWQRNNLRIAAPLPQRIVERVPHTRALEPFLAKAAERKQVLKAIGDGWGMSGAAESRDWLVPMVDSFDAVSPPEGQSCRMAGGARVSTLNTALATAGRSLVNAPGYDQLTFVGAMTMGGHGSGLGLAPLAEQAVSLELLYVNRDGQPCRRRFVKGDPLFPAVVTSLGALGIVTELEIAVDDAYFIEETRRLRPWDDVKRELPELLARQRRKELHSAEIWLSPYPVRGRVWCVVGTRKKSAGPGRGERGWAVTHGDRARFQALSVFMRAFPNLIPLLLHGALSLTQSEAVVLPSSVGLDFGTTNLAPVLASECSIDAADLIPTVDTLIRGIQRRAAESGFWVTSPLGLRFVAAGSAWMSPAHGRETCTIELPELDGTPHARETLEWFVRVAVPHGRPHWGQWNPLSAAELRERYPRDSTRAFAAALAELDPCHVFENAFVRDLRTGWGTDSQRPTLFPVPLVAEAGGCSEASVRSYSRLFCDPGSPARLEVSIEGILEALRNAKDSGWQFTRRGGGYAMHTQSLRPLNVEARYLAVTAPARERIRIDTAARTLTVTADATWHAIVHATLAEGLLPKVIVTAPNATVGGTLASNSIGQACRRFGHEADGLVSVTVAVPGNAGEAPREITLLKPQDGDRSEEAQVFYAVIRGYGHIGVIVRATYELTETPADTKLPPVDDCGGRCSPDEEGERCVAVTDVVAFSQDQLAEALELLVRPPTGDDGLYRACVVFKVRDGWSARVTTTRFETGRFGPHLVTYEGDTTSRTLAELLLSTMPTAYVAGRIAAKLTENGQDGYRDPPCGYLFTMLANEAFKEKLPKAVTAIVAPTVQMTFIVPERNGVEFLQRTFRIMRFGEENIPGDQLERTVKKLKEREQTSLKDWLLELLEKTRELEQKYLGSSEVPDDPSDDARLRSFLTGVMSSGTLIPALFEMVWLPADHHLLSVSHGQSGFAISFAFQGPGTDRRGFFEQLWPFSEIVQKLYRALERLSETAVELGGGVHLTKNVFVGDNPKEFIARMLGPRLAAFAELRDRYDEKHVLSSAFGEEVLGLSGALVQD